MTTSLFWIFFFRYSCRAAWCCYSMSYSYPLNSFCIEFRRSRRKLSCMASLLSGVLSILVSVNGGRHSTKQRNRWCQTKKPKFVRTDNRKVFNIDFLNLIQSIIFYKGQKCLPGIKGASVVFAISDCQSTSRSHRWFLTSWGPFNPSLLAGFLYRSLLMKSAASIVHPSGRSAFFRLICLLKIWSRMSLRVFPV